VVVVLGVVDLAVVVLGVVDPVVVDQEMVIGGVVVIGWGGIVWYFLENLHLIFPSLDGSMTSAGLKPV